MLTKPQKKSKKFQKSDRKLRYRPNSPESSEKRDFAEIEKIEKGGPIAMADYTIINTRDEKYLQKQLDQILSQISKVSKLKHSSV